MQGLPFTVFQPLYLYGPHTNKDYMPYFLGRLMRGRPVPLPAPGIQITSLTHIEDLAALLAKARSRPQPTRRRCLIWPCPRAPLAWPAMLTFIAVWSAVVDAFKCSWLRAHLP